MRRWSDRNLEVSYSAILLVRETASANTRLLHLSHFASLIHGVPLLNKPAPSTNPCYASIFSRPDLFVPTAAPANAPRGQVTIVMAMVVVLPVPPRHCHPTAQDSSVASPFEASLSPTPSRSASSAMPDKPSTSPQPPTLSSLTAQSSPSSPS